MPSRDRLLFAGMLLQPTSLPVDPAPTKPTFAAVILALSMVAVFVAALY